MANENLKTALQMAGLTAEQFAELIEVDPKTVQRWLAGRTPYTRHRAKLARALDTTEHALWPQLPTETAGEPSGSNGPVGDLLAAHPTANRPDKPDRLELLAAATERIELLDESVEQLLVAPGVSELLVAKASDACQIRILVSEPGRYLVSLIGQPGIEISVLETFPRQTIQRTDEQMLLTIILAGEPADDGPLLHLRRTMDNGLFDRYVGHFDDLWENDSEPIETDADLARHTIDDDQDHPRPSGPATSSAENPPVDTNTGGQIADPSPAARHQTAEQPQRVRRWPGRA